MAELLKQSSSIEGRAVIGRGTIVKGSIHSKQDLLLEGEIEGVLVLEDCNLTIGPHGKAVANTSARDMDIQGSVTGNVECTGKTSLRTCGSLIGDIRTAGIVIETGAYFKGRVEIVSTRGEAGRAGDA